MLNSMNDVWKMVLDTMSKTLTPITINTWFDEVSVVTMEDSAFVLHCSSDFKKATIEKRFIKNIQDALREIFSADFEIKILDDDQLATYHKVGTDIPGRETEGFTFETYVVGPQNKMAYAAARSVSEKPAGNFNPLFIYGDSGLGKTHLLYAIAHQTKVLRPESLIVYIKGDDFTNDLVNAIRGGTTTEFRDKYRHANLLLVDDIQFIAGKQQTQEEFFHTFNSLYESGSQIVMTSDRPPREMSLLDDRLRTRFEWGLLVDVAPPDFETRLAIIKNKAALLGIQLPDSVMDYIAENVTSNVRQIEGTLNMLLAYSDLLGDKMTAKEIEKVISANNSETIVTPEVIISYISKYFDMDPEIIRGKGQNQEIVNARQISMYLIRRMTNLSLNDIGKEFGGKDHTTVLHSLDKVETKMRTDSSFAEVVKEITTNINAKK